MKRRSMRITLLIITSLALLTGCLTPTAVDNPMPPSTETAPTVEVPTEGVSADDTAQLRIDLEKAQIAYQDLLRTYRAETDDLNHLLSQAKKQLEDSRATYTTLWNTYQSLAIKKTQTERENVELHEDIHFRLQDLQSMSLKMQTELECLHTNWTRNRATYNLLNQESLPAGHFMIPNEDEYKEAYENRGDEYLKLRNAAKSLVSKYESWYRNTEYMSSDFDILLQTLDKMNALISQLKEAAK